MLGSSIVMYTIKATKKIVYYTASYINGFLFLINIVNSSLMGIPRYSKGAVMLGFCLKDSRLLREEIMKIIMKFTWNI